MFEGIKNFFYRNDDNQKILSELQGYMEEAENQYYETYRWKEAYKKLYHSYRKKNDELLAKERVLDATNEISKKLSYFQINEAYDSNLYDILRILGEKLRVDRCYIYQYSNIHGKFDLYSEWKNDNVNSKPKEHDLLFWLDIFYKNQIICGKTDDFTIEEKNVLRPQQIESICLVPIFILDYFWGFIGFDSCIEQRDWYYEEENALSQTAEIIGLSLCSKAIFNKLIERKTLLEESLDLSSNFMWWKNLNNVFVEANSACINLCFNGEVNKECRDLNLMCDTLFNDKDAKKEWYELVTTIDNTVIHEEIIGNYYLMFRDKSDELNILEVVKNPWYSNISSEVIGIVGVGVDKTNKKLEILQEIEDTLKYSPVYIGNYVFGYKILS